MIPVTGDKRLAVRGDLLFYGIDQNNKYILTRA